MRTLLARLVLMTVWMTLVAPAGVHAQCAPPACDVKCPPINVTICPKNLVVEKDCCEEKSSCLSKLFCKKKCQRDASSRSAGAMSIVTVAQPMALNFQPQAANFQSFNVQSNSSIEISNMASLRAAHDMEAAVVRYNAVRAAEAAAAKATADAFGRIRQRMESGGDNNVAPPPADAELSKKLDQVSKELSATIALVERHDEVMRKLYEKLFPEGKPSLDEQLAKISQSLEQVREVPVVKSGLPR